MSDTPSTRSSSSLTWMVAKLLRYLSSYRPSGEKKLTISSRSGVFLRTVIPWFCTGLGSSGRASATRFCTFTRDVLMSVPTSNVTARL